ncbi:MAG: hypothetical protein U0361_05960 [Nitrospiraceae bacterium]
MRPVSPRPSDGYHTFPAVQGWTTAQGFGSLHHVHADSAGAFASPCVSSVRVKSRYLSGLQCHKRLYLEIHRPDLATPPDAATQAILDMGTDLGERPDGDFPADDW